jgi:hypothetical protein
MKVPSIVAVEIITIYQQKCDRKIILEPNTSYGTICSLDFTHYLFSKKTQHFGDWLCPRLQVMR